MSLGHAAKDSGVRGSQSLSSVRDPTEYWIAYGMGYQVKSGESLIRLIFESEIDPRDRRNSLEVTD